MGLQLSFLGRLFLACYIEVCPVDFHDRMWIGSNFQGRMEHLHRVRRQPQRDVAPGLPAPGRIQDRAARRRRRLPALPQQRHRLRGRRGMDLGRHHGAEPSGTSRLQGFGGSTRTHFLTLKSEVTIANWAATVCIIRSPACGTCYNKRSAKGCSQGTGPTFKGRVDFPVFLQSNLNISFHFRLNPFFPDFTTANLRDKLLRESLGRRQVRLPRDLECVGCTVRLMRQAREWGGGYRFWSCADVDIIANVAASERCSGKGRFNKRSGTKYLKEAA